MSEMSGIEYVVEPIAAMDGWQVQAFSKTWLDPADEAAMAGHICYAERGREQLGILAIDAAGKVLIAEVAPEHRRQGIATAMREVLLAEGHRVVHDWDNMLADGAAWVASLEGALEEPRP